MKPEAPQLLDAVAALLQEDLGITDRGAAFRVRIAAYLVSMVARELRAAPVEADLAEQVRAIRAGDTSEAMRETLMEQLRAELAIVQPRFDTDLDAEQL